uniref:Spondin domain-containing protein n=1 Tax=Timema tahoe TaxID=61484 RepID=A0A7R9NYM0_9NEOP|nr:unnamed protein product [Timema tahoe]
MCRIVTNSPPTSPIHPGCAREYGTQLFGEYRKNVTDAADRVVVFVSLQVDPLDAGTDNGFTFTAPNWPTDPQGVVYKVTSRYPSHPAGSFYYPYMKRLPPIATFQFIKVPSRQWQSQCSEVRLFIMPL